jgi:hypothetical protein
VSPALLVFRRPSPAASEAACVSPANRRDSILFELSGSKPVVRRPVHLVAGVSLAPLAGGVQYIKSAPPILLGERQIAGDASPAATARDAAGGPQ